MMTQWVIVDRCTQGGLRLKVRVGLEIGYTEIVYWAVEHSPRDSVFTLIRPLVEPAFLYASRNELNPILHIIFISGQHIYAIYR